MKGCTGINARFKDYGVELLNVSFLGVPLVGVIVDLGITRDSYLRKQLCSICLGLNPKP